jgi:hypothetical protein
MHYRIVNANFPEIIDKIAAGVGNENVVNEKVHSFEAGWRGHFLDERLRVSVDLFYNIYLDMISVKTDLKWDDLGRPDVLNSTIEFQNEDTRIHAVGGEAELAVGPLEGWTFWTNVGLRRVTSEGDQPLPKEPLLRLNLGGRWSRGAGVPGPVADLALHFVTDYELAMALPDDTLEEPVHMPLGNNLLLIGRLGYRTSLGDAGFLEAGLVVRAPLGEDFREFGGFPVQASRYTITSADLGGEMIVRIVSFYLRGAF